MALYAVGRFQPPTIGHAKMIESVRDMASAAGVKAFVFVSSTQGSGKERANNPLTSTEKTAFLQKMFPTGIEFVDTALCEPRCGGPLAAFIYLRDRGFTDISLVGGSDRTADFGPKGRIWDSLKADGEEPPKFVTIQRNAVDTSLGADPSLMSGTKARGFVRAGDLANFTKAVTYGSVTPEDAKLLFGILKSRLEEPATKRARIGGEIELSSFGADNEPQGGKRTRRKKVRSNRASSKALYRRGLRSHIESSKTSRSSYALPGYSISSSTL